MGKASLWFHLFRPITHTLHTVSFACHLMTDQPACIISAVAQWKEDLGIMRSWRKWSAVLPKRNGVQKSSTAAGVPMTMWEAVSFQFSRKLRAKKLLFVREDTHGRQSSSFCLHKMSFQLSLSWLKQLVSWAAFNTRLVLIICSLFFLGIFCFFFPPYFMVNLLAWM